MEPRASVAIVDDDESVRESLPDLLHELGYTARAFASAGGYRASGFIPQTQCLLLDIAMPDMIRLPQLQRELLRDGYTFPVIFITAMSDKSLPPGLLQNGAVDCLFKPFSEESLRRALNAAFSK